MVDRSSQGADVIHANKQPNLHFSLMAMFVDSCDREVALTVGLNLQVKFLHYSLFLGGSSNTKKKAKSKKLGPENWTRLWTMRANNALFQF